MKPIFRILYRLYRAVSSLRYWAQRHLTRPGLALLAALLAATVMGVDTDNNVGYQAFALLLGLLLIAAIGSLFFRARFSATRHLPRFGTAGCPLAYSVVVDNLSAKPQTGLTLLEELADPRPSFQEWFAAQLDDEKHSRPFRFSQGRRLNPFRRATVREAVVPPIPPKASAVVQVELTPLRRGVLRFKGLALARPDPLGLVRALSKVSLPQTTLILPKRYRLPAFTLPGRMKYQQGGVALASHVGQSEDFVALRDYRQGDPLRHIHWRSWARAGKPVVKEFEDEFFVRHALVLDTFTDSHQSDVFEEAVAVAASFACAIETQESLLDLLFVGPESYCFTAGRGLGQADQMLEILAGVRVCREQPFQSLAHLVLNHTHLVSGCICVLVHWDEPRRELVAKLKMMGVPVQVLMIVPPGHQTRLDPGPLRDDPERFLVLETGQVEAGLANLK